MQKKLLWKSLENIYFLKVAIIRALNLDCFHEININCFVCHCSILDCNSKLKLKVIKIIEFNFENILKHDVLILPETLCNKVMPQSRIS